ncbi:hypothetical protein MHH81_11215 [Psychrobacillus sp. FSL H8-0484]|uniref:hypothetical protein n=1 Tax=Psychrobacillus sp. FSL H8-0484 TaxID=2921390 RepID=UPI0030F66D4A
MLLSKAWALFEAYKRIEGFSSQTLKAYQLQSLLLIGYFKDVEMDLLDTNQLKEHLAISGKHLKPARLAHRIRFMKLFFRWSHEEGYLSKNPTSKIKEPKVERLNTFVNPLIPQWKWRFLKLCFLKGVKLEKQSPQIEYVLK